MKPVRFIRSALFVPGNQPERIDKAVRSSADMVIIDLEDGVPHSEKASARSLVRQKIIQHAGRPLMVRVNALDTGLTAADLEAALTPGVDAIMLPKVQTPDDVHRIHVMITERESAKGIECGSTELVAMIESALGVENAFRIASANTEPARIHTLAFGAADFTLDMGVRISKSGEELFYPRARIALACRAAGLDGPLDTPFMIDLKDMEAFAADSLRGKNLGFGGKICVHPNQIDVANRIYSPSSEDIEFADKVVRSFEESEASGIGVIQVEGKMIDPPIVAQCRRILAIAAAMKR